MNTPAHSPSSRSQWVIWLSLAAMAILVASHARADDLKLVFTPTWNGQPIQVNHWIPDAAPAGRSVSEIRFLLSRPSVQHEDGTWQTIRDAFALIDLADGKTATTTLRGLKAETITGIRFDVGVPPTENGADLPTLDASHPLNPATCVLKLANQPGYTFISLAGLWRQEDGQLGHFQYQLAGDPYIARVELPVKPGTSDSNSLHIAFDAAVAVSDFDPKRMSAVKSHPALTTFSFNVRKAFKLIEDDKQSAPSTFKLSQN